MCLLLRDRDLLASIRLRRRLLSILLRGGLISRHRGASGTPGLLLSAIGVVLGLACVRRVLLRRIHHGRVLGRIAILGSVAHGHAVHGHLWVAHLRVLLAAW